MSAKKTPPRSEGEYVTRNGQKYFLIGKTYIKITEHFEDKGPSLMDKLADVITYTARTVDLNKIA